MRLGESARSLEIESISTGSLGLDIALGIGGLPRGRVVEIYGPESLGQDHAGAARRRRGAEERRHLRLHRRRACARSDLCPQARRQCRRSADLAARHRRAGARNRRHAGALRRHRRAGDRFGRGADAAGRARRRDGRLAARPAGAPDEPGAAQAHRLDLASPRRMVIFINQIRMKIGVMFGSPGDHDRRQCAEILRLGPPRHPPHRRDQGARGGRRQPDPRQGGQEQAGAAVQAGRVRHHVWRGHLQDRRAARSRRQGRRSSRSPAPGSPTTASASARAARTPSQFLKDNPDDRRRDRAGDPRRMPG